MRVPLDLTRVGIVDVMLGPWATTVNSNRLHPLDVSSLDAQLAS